MDYAIPRALQSYGYLERLVTDLHFDSPPPLQRLRNYRSGIPRSRVSSDNRTGLVYRAILSCFAMRAWPHLLAAEAVAARTCDLVESTGADLVYGFDTAMLPTMDRLRRADAMIVMEQCIAPRMQFLSALSILDSKLQEVGIDLEESGLNQNQAYFAIMAAVETEEWSRADKLYCPSPFVREALVKQGVAPEKIRVVPYGISLCLSERRGKGAGGRPRVVFGGAFSWRKGALEFGRLASTLSGAASFEAYGKNLLSGPMTRRVAPDVHQRGHVQKSCFHSAIADADIFVLPSYMEGSATVVYEAMAMGLACVVTAQCGSVITDGVDGLIVEAGDDAALQAAVEKLLDDPAMRRDVGMRAAETARAHTRESYGRAVGAWLVEDLAAYRGAV